MDPGFSQPVAEMSTGRFLGCKARPEYKVDKDNVGSPTSQTPIDFHDLLQGQLYFFCVLYSLCVMCPTLFVWLCVLCFI
jgi:hypothetical protein